MKEVSRPKEKRIVIKERSSTLKGPKVKQFQSKRNGKGKVYEVDDMIMGDGKGVEEDKVGTIMIAINESDAYIQDE